MYQRLFSITLLGVFILLFSGCVKKDTDIIYDKKYLNEIKELRKDAGFYLARNFIPGGSFAVAKNGKIIYSEGIGLASKDLNVKMTRKTKLRIGQVSELFTSLIYRKLEAEGILHPDSSISFYLPDFPGFDYDLKIKHLVDHTSGMPKLSTSEEDWAAINVSLKMGIDKLQNKELLGYPGAFQDLSGYNYNLLGAAMEQASGKRFSQLLQEYVTDTLQLNNTTLDNPFITIEGRSDFFDHNLVAQTVNAVTVDLRYRAPSQGVLSNAEDLVKFGIAILHSEYISEEIRSKLFERVTLEEGMIGNIASAWLLLFDGEGRSVYGRAGEVVGGGAAILVYPEHDLVVAGAVNLTSSLDEIPVFQFASLFLPEEQKIETKKLEPAQTEEKSE